MGISSIEEYEAIQPTARVDGMLFNVPTRHVQWRIETMYTKEPDTVAWIRGMKEGEVFYDVGANIGLYTMLAVKQGLHVFAFEPEAQNYALLIRNLAMNQYTKSQVVAFPFCISDGQSVNTLRLQSLQVGGSCHSFASDLNYKREEKQWAYEQGSVGFSLDALVLECGLPQPTHIKVDVDGFEDKVVNGAGKVLDHVQSILVEMDSNNPDHLAIQDNLLARGFAVDEAQVQAAMRREGPFTGIGNRIYTRGSNPVSDAAENHSEAG